MYSIVLDSLYFHIILYYINNNNIIEYIVRKYKIIIIKKWKSYCLILLSNIVYQSIYNIDKQYKFLYNFTVK